jgi:hypothetical protein
MRLFCERRFAPDVLARSRNANERSSHFERDQLIFSLTIDTVAAICRLFASGTTSGPLTVNKRDGERALSDFTSPNQSTFFVLPLPPSPPPLEIQYGTIKFSDISIFLPITNWARLEPNAAFRSPDEENPSVRMSHKEKCTRAYYRGTRISIVNDDVLVVSRRSWQRDCAAEARRTLAQAWSGIMREQFGEWS